MPDQKGKKEMTLNVDPVTVAVGLAIFGWIFRVDRKLTKLETWIKSCSYCRESLKPNDERKP